MITLTNNPHMIETHSENLKVKFAKMFHELGYRIIPLNGIGSNGNCTCYLGDKCTSPGKHPLKDHTPLKDSKEIESFFSIFKDHNYGVSTDGLVVIDIDQKNGGVNSFKEYLSKVVDQSTTFTVTTGSSSNSKHIYYQDKNNQFSTKINLFPGIDIKARAGNYVVGPGSKHKTGNYYTPTFPVTHGSNLLLSDPSEDLTKLILSPTYQTISLPSTSKIVEGGRNNSLYSIARRLIETGVSPENVATEVHHINTNSCEKPLCTKEVEQILLSAEKKRDVSGAHFTPEPLSHPISEAAPYPFQNLGGILGPAAKKLYDTVQAPDGICANSILSAASLALQGLADIKIDNRSIPTTLFLISIAESGERKSSVKKIIMSEIESFEKSNYEIYKQELDEYEKQVTQYERILKKNSPTPEEQDLPRPKEPIQPHMIVEEPTYEAVVSLLEYGRPSIGIITDEGGRLIGGVSMNKDNSLKTLAGFSKFWDAAPVSKSRKGSGTTKLYGKRVTLHLMVQPSVFSSLTAIEHIKTQGFFARCLISFPKGKVGYRQIKQMLPEKMDEVDRFSSIIRKAITTELPLSDSRNELNPREIQLDSKGLLIYQNYESKIESMNGSKRKYSSIQGLAAKAPEHTLRLAGILTLVENLHATVIDVEALENAIKLVDYYLEEALRMEDLSLISEDIISAKDLLDYLHSNGDQYFHSTQILQYGPRKIRNKNKLIKTMKILEDHGWVYKIPGGLKINNSPKKNVWRVIPNKL